MYKNAKRITLTRYRDLLLYNCERFYVPTEEKEYQIIGKDSKYLYLRQGIETSCNRLDASILLEVLIDVETAAPIATNSELTKDQVTIGMLQELLRAAWCDLHTSPSCLTCSQSDTKVCQEIHNGGCSNYRWRYEEEVKVLLGDDTRSCCNSCPTSE